MRKMALLMALILVLTSCGGAETFETVNDEMEQQVMADPFEIRVDLPEDSVMPAMESEAGKLYLCGDYDVLVQTLPAGDLDATVRTVSGYGLDELTVIHTGSGELEKYEFVWTMAGEMGQQIGRATILDDGYYHYVLSASVNSEKIEEYQEVWNGIFESFHVA